MRRRWRPGDLGIAMGAAGSEVAIHSATIALMNNDLRRLPFLLRLSRETRRVINQNFLLGICFVIGGLVLAAMKLYQPDPGGHAPRRRVAPGCLQQLPPGAAGRGTGAARNGSGRNVPRTALLRSEAMQHLSLP